MTGRATSAWPPFPTVAGGQGNPSDLVGNTASYVAIASHATAAQKAVAEAFLRDQLATSAYAKASVGAGEVPVIKGAAPLFAGQQLASYDQTIYSSVRAGAELPVLLGPGAERRRRRPPC